MSVRKIKIDVPLCLGISGPTKRTEIKANQDGILGILLAGVHGWGNCPMEQFVPRPLVPILGQPLISHALSWLRHGGINRASICANSDTAAFHRVFGTGSEQKIALDYYEDVMPRGPAGCMRDAIVNTHAETFVVLEGTILPLIDLPQLLEAHHESGAVLTITAANSNGIPALCGQMLEPVGIYIFSRRVLEHIPETGYQDIKEGLIPRLHDQGLAVNTCTVPGCLALRVQDAASYLRICKWIVEQVIRKGGVPAGYASVDEAWIHKSAKLDSSARLVGPVLVEPGCVIEAGAIITGPTTIGEGCRVAGNAVISRSVIWSCCEIGTGAIIDNSILTDNAKIDADQVVRNTICPRSKSWPSALAGVLRSCVRLVRGKNHLFEGSPTSQTDLSAASDQWLAVETRGRSPLPSPAIVGKRRDSSSFLEGEKC